MPPRFVNVTIIDIDDMLPTFDHPDASTECVIPIYTADTSEDYTVISLNVMIITFIYESAYEMSSIFNKALNKTWFDMKIQLQETTHALL